MILLHPTPKAYYDLSGALLGSRQYKEATDALFIAEHLGYTPLANVMFRYAYAYANISDEDHEKENEKSAIHYMEVAIQMGYEHPRQFLKRKFFPLLIGYTLFGSSAEKEEQSAGNSDCLTLISYTPQGKIIDKMNVAGRTGLSENYKVFTLQPNLQFEVRKFEYVFDKDPADAGFDSSNIKTENPLPPVDYRI